MKKILFAIAISCLFCSCESFFDREPFDEVGSEKFFRSENDLVLYTNGFIEKNMPGYATLMYGDQYSDILAVNITSDYLKTAWSADKQTGWSKSNWEQIHNVNYYLVNMHKAAKAVSEPKMKHYQGVGRFWRAWLYYDKVQTFGGVPWYEAQIDPEDMEALYKPRDTREYVMGKVLEDLNYAVTNCSTEQKFLNNSCINRYVALAFKARVCLFEGTYRKYHPELGLQGTSQIWLQEAASACEELMTNSPYSLVSNLANVKTQYRQLFTSSKVDYKEIIYANEYSDEALRLHEATWKFTSASYGNRWSLTKEFVNTYLMLDGSRFTDRPDYNKTEFPVEVQNRDMRLQQSIITPTYTKKVAGNDKATAPNFSVTLTGYQVIKWSLDDDKYEGIANSNNSPCVFRFAEVLLNYAEAKAELGEFTEAIWDKTIKLLRDRAGVNSKIPTSPDPYLVAFYNNQTSDKWILEIRRERAIELLLENLRYNDLMRWKLGSLLERPWSGIYIPAKNVAYDLNADGINDVCVVDSNPGKEKGVFYIDLSKFSQYKLTNENCISYNETKMWTERKYLHPIPKTARDVNPALEQNDGWEDQ